MATPYKAYSVGRKTVGVVSKKNYIDAIEMDIECFSNTSVGVLSLCTVMGKELDCEGEAGTIRVVWSTSIAADSTVYTSVVGPTGPWNLRYHSDVDTECHDVQFPSPAVDATVWFYVRSESPDGQIVTSGVYMFCTSGIVTLESGNFDISITTTLVNTVSALVTIQAGEADATQPNNINNQTFNQISQATTIVTVGATATASVDTWTTEIGYSVT